jgi:hypothetical protein
MSTYEICSLILNVVLVAIGVATIFVVIRIYKQQKNDARILQEKQLRETERLQKEVRRKEIFPDLKDGSAGSTGGAVFYSNFYFNKYDALHIYLGDVILDETKVKIHMDEIRSIPKGREFPVRGSYLIEYAKFEKYKFYYSIYYCDTDGNKYKAEIENIGMSATVLNNNPL